MRTGSHPGTGNDPRSRTGQTTSDPETLQAADHRPAQPSLKSKTSPGNAPVTVTRSARPHEPE